MSQPSDYPPPPPGAPPPPGPPPSPGLSGGSYAAGPSPTARLPWEERDRRGFLEAFIETTKLIATNAHDAFSRLRKDGDLVSPVLFGMIISWIAAVIAQLWQAAMSSVFTLGSFGADLGAGLGSGIVGVLTTLILWPIIFVISMVIGTLIYHGCLMLLGGLNNPGMGWEGTLKVLCYAQVAALGNVVPVVGVFLTLGAMIYFMFIGFQATHRSTQGQAIGASVIPMVLCCLCGVVMVFVFGAAMATAVAGMG